MSLFHVQEWYRTEVEGAHSIAVAQLFDYRDQVIVGSLSGTLTVLDPGRNVDHRQEKGLLIQAHMAAPCLQVSSGKFLSSNDEVLLAVLHPRTVVYLQLKDSSGSGEGEAFELETVAEIKLPGAPAFNFCQGQFGKSSSEQICIQSLSCSLTVFDGETRVLSRSFDELAAVQPGPIEYTPYSDSFLMTSLNGCLSSIRYDALIAPTSKKVQPDWELSLGDTALRLCVIGILPIQPSILVLCKRTVYCITHGGSPRFTIRLQCVATSMRILHDDSHGQDASIHLCIGTSTNTLLFYRDARMQWTSQLEFVPIQVEACTFNESLRSLLAILSDDRRFVIGYLGTEPSLFRMPATESRFIDFGKRKQELKELEESIKRCDKQSPVEDGGGGLAMRVEITMDKNSMAYDSKETVPSASLLLNIDEAQSTDSPVTFLLQGDIFYAKRTTTLSSPAQPPSTALMLFCKDSPVLDLRCRIIALSRGSSVAGVQKFRLPLQLVCRRVPPQKGSTAFKLSIESTGETPELDTLFPEFNCDQSALGLQPYYCPDSVVSIFFTGKNDRYRIQSASADFLYVVFEELMRRLRAHQPGVHLHSPLPMPIILSEAGRRIELDKKREEAMRAVSRASSLIRHVETILLSKLKSDRETVPTHITALTNYCYQSLMTSVEELVQVESQLAKRTGSLRSLLNLARSILLPSHIRLPIDGEIFGGCEKDVGSMLGSLLSNDSADTADYDFATISRLLNDTCQKGGQLAGIIEEDENEEGGHLPDKKKGGELEESTAMDEFVDLKSGSLSAKPNSLTG